MTDELFDDQAEERRPAYYYFLPFIPPPRMILLFVLLAGTVTVLVAMGRMNLREVVFASLGNPWLLWLSVAFLANVLFQAGENEIIGPASTYDYQVELEKHLVLRNLDASTRNRDKVEYLISIKKSVFLFPPVYDEGQLVRMSGWAVFFSFWTFLGLLVALLVLNWQWTLVLSLAALVLFYLPFFRKAGLILAKPLFRPLRQGADH